MAYVHTRVAVCANNSDTLHLTAIVAVETVLLVLLVVLVAGLLRSHAEILRLLGESGDPARGAVPPPALPQRTGAELLPAQLTGSTPHGDAVALSFDGAASRPTRGTLWRNPLLAQTQLNNSWSVTHTCSEQVGDLVVVKLYYDRKPHTRSRPHHHHSLRAPWILVAAQPRRPSLVLMTSSLK